jgi:hypothetical protein
MEVFVGILSAVIAVVVSLIAAVISSYTNRNALRAEREKLERELQRKLTEKLYDQRLETYPEAIKITDGLRPSRLLERREPLTEEYFQGIVTRLDQWQNTKVGFLLSDNSLAKLNELRTILREQPQSNGSYSSDQVERFLVARRAFRTALRTDVHLLFREESFS